MGAIEVDVTGGALWLVRFPSRVDLDDYIDLMDEMRGYSEQFDRYAVLFDLREYGPLSATNDVRAQAARLLRKEQEQVRHKVVCEARVASGPIMQAVITVFDWHASPPWPCANVRDWKRGEDWARERLARDGLSAGGTIRP